MAHPLPKHPKQADIQIYVKDYCPYCSAAENLLTQKGVGFEEIDISEDSSRQQEMLSRAAPRRTVPQIFINGQGIGGFDDMKKLDNDGKLDKMLFPEGRP